MEDRFPVFVSVIIPVYNVERYLRECLDSVVNQTLREIQIICVNNGSEDGSLAILREYAGRDPRMMVLDQTNEGQSIARNLAIAHAAGEYIVFVDSDDTIDRDLCRRAYELAKKRNSDIVLYDFSTFTNVRDIPMKAETSTSLSAVRSSERATLLRQMGVVWTKCVRTDFIRSNDIRFPERRIYEDIFVHWQFVILFHDLEILPEKLYHYRIQPSATTYRTDWKITDRIFIFDMIHDFLISRNLYKEYQDVFLQSQLEAFYWIYDTIDTLHKNEVMVLIRERLHEGHWTIIDSAGGLTWKTRDFYRAIRGSFLAIVRRSLWLFTRYCYRGIKRLSGHFFL